MFMLNTYYEDTEFKYQFIKYRKSLMSGFHVANMVT